jgi:hypothetical protein
MKVHKFEITEIETSTSSSFMDNLLSELSDEKRQLELTREVNKKTSEIHRKILENIVAELNEQLAPIDNLEFYIAEGTTDKYGYRTSSGGTTISSSKFCDRSIQIEPIKDEEFPSKYRTFTGAYKIILFQRKMGYSKHTVETVEDILKEMRNDIKRHVQQTHVLGL